MEFVRTVPVLRMFSIEKAREFYLGFLGFAIDFEHRFEPDMPLYMGISRGGVTLHLSEHHGDGSPGVHVRVEMTGIDEVRLWPAGDSGSGVGERSLTAHDPFNNVITFCERIK